MGPFSLILKKNNLLKKSMAQIAAIGWTQTPEMQKFLAGGSALVKSSTYFLFRYLERLVRSLVYLPI